MNPLHRRTVLTQGHVEYVDHMGDDLTVVNAARVSFNKQSEWEYDEQGKPELKLSDSKLIKYLAEYNHWSPFAHALITFRIKAPIPIRTQFFKHTVGFTANEQSKRYITDPPELYIPPWRTAPDENIKQGSNTFIEDAQQADICTGLYASSASAAITVYYSLINDHGVAPEQARMVLPQGVYTEWYWTGSLAAYSRFYKLRIDPHAQWEIRCYAEAIGGFLEKLYPDTWQALIGTDETTPVPKP